jgi:hypothetical protein
VPWGMFQGLTTAYASEVAPVVLSESDTSFRPAWHTADTLPRTVLDVVYQSLVRVWLDGKPGANIVQLGIRALSRSRNTASAPRPHRQVWLQDSFRSAVDVASSLGPRHRLCSSVTLVVGPQRSSPGCQELAEKTDDPPG